MMGGYDKYRMPARALVMFKEEGGVVKYKNNLFTRSLTPTRNAYRGNNI